MNREERNRRARENYAYKKVRSRCVKCGVQDAYTLNGRSHCADCAEYERNCKRKVNHEKQREVYHQRKEHHLCVTCASPLSPSYDKVRCQKCLQRESRYNRKRRRKDGILPREDFVRQRLDCGLCWICMKEEPVPGKKTCPACYEAAKDRMAKARGANETHIWRKMNEECLKSSSSQGNG